jgi:hypothetical protein
MEGIMRELKILKDINGILYIILLFSTHVSRS